MPRSVAPGLKEYAFSLMIEENLPQREISKITGLSRAYLRKISREIGHQFAINGIDVIGKASMCLNCGVIFRRSPSRVVRASNHFCDKECKDAWQTGPNHPSWKDGKTASTFSKWIVNQSEYKKWKEDVLARDGGKCAISGRTDNLDCHHIIPKHFSPEKALDVNNGITLNREIHEEIHELIRKGTDFNEALVILNKKYSNERNGVSVKL